MAIIPEKRRPANKMISCGQTGQISRLTNVFEHPALETAESHNYTALTVF
jgi:hypothetical protein